MTNKTCLPHDYHIKRKLRNLHRRKFLVTSTFSHSMLFAINSRLFLQGYFNFIGRLLHQKKLNLRFTKTFATDKKANTKMRKKTQ